MDPQLKDPYDDARIIRMVGSPTGTQREAFHTCPKVGFCDPALQSYQARFIERLNEVYTQYITKGIAEVADMHDVPPEQIKERIRVQELMLADGTSQVLLFVKTEAGDQLHALTCNWSFTVHHDGRVTFEVSNAIPQ